MVDHLPMFGSRVARPQTLDAGGIPECSIPARRTRIRAAIVQTRISRADGASRVERMASLLIVSPAGDRGRSAARPDVRLLDPRPQPLAGPRQLFDGAAEVRRSPAGSAEGDDGLRGEKSTQYALSLGTEYSPSSLRLASSLAKMGPRSRAQRGKASTDALRRRPLRVGLRCRTT